MNLDLVLKVDSPPPLMDESTPDDKRKIERSERSNCMCIIIMKKVILQSFKGFMSQRITTSTKFLVKIENGFVKNKKAKIGKLLMVTFMHPMLSFTITNKIKND